jgi:hypothetical protein
VKVTDSAQRRGRTDITLDEARRLVLGSDIDDWAWFEGLDGDDEVVQTNQATYKPEVLLAMHWGRTAIRGFREAWSERFADRNARSLYLDVLYAGSLISRDILVSVDGGRYNPYRNWSLQTPKWSIK